MDKKKTGLSLLIFWLAVVPLCAQDMATLLQEEKRATSAQKKLQLYNLISQEYRETDPQRAIMYGEKAATLSTKVNNLKQLTQAYNNISIGYYWLNDLTKASEYAYKALKIQEQTTDSAGLAASYNVIGNIYRKQKNYKKSLEYFQNALKIGELINKTNTISVALNNIGTAYELLEQPRKALDYYLRAHQFHATHDGDTFDRAIDALNIGNVYFVLGNKKRALEYLHQALSLSQEIKNEINKIYIYKTLAKLHLQSKAYGKASLYAQQSLAISQQVPSPEGVQEAALLLNNIYQAQGNYKKAHHYLLLHTAYKDSIYTRQAAEVQAEMHTKYETAKKESENRRLRAEQKLQEKELFEKSLIQYATVILLILVAIIAYVFFKSRNQIKATNQTLSDFNRIILEKNSDIKLQKEELERLNNQKVKLFSVIAHDLRGPLISLRSLLQILPMGTLPPEKLERFVRDLDSQQQNTLDLLDNLLAWAKIQMQGLNIVSQPLPLRGIVENTVQLLRPQADKKGVSLQNHVTEDHWVLADAEMIKLVLRNLLSNAIKFCYQGGLVDITATPTNDSQLIIAIKDTGIGISAENQLKLFGPNNFKERGTANEKGSGLGLMLCKEFVEKNSGELWVESEKGKGSQFYISLLSAPNANPNQTEKVPTSLNADALL